MGAFLPATAAKRIGSALGSPPTRQPATGPAPTPTLRTFDAKNGRHRIALPGSANMAAGTIPRTTAPSP